MTGTELGALLVLATATSFTPGPNTTLSTALAANHGLPQAMRFVCAVPVGWLMLLALCASGVAALVLAAPMLRGAIVLGGVGYLLWLAWRLARTSRLSSTQDALPQVGFVRGVGLQFLNIKAWMLALSIVAGWIAGHPDAWQRFVLTAPVLMAYAFASNLTYALVGALLRGWLAGPVVNGQHTGQRLRLFNWAMALALVLTAVWMGVSGLMVTGQPGLG